MQDRRTSLRAFLIFPAALFVVIAAGVSWFQRDAAADDARQTAVADARFAARLAARELDSAIDQALEQVTITASSPGITAVFDASDACTLTFSPSGPFGRGHLDIVAADGTVACSSRRSDGKSYNGQEWLAKALEGQALHGSVVDARTGEASLAISAAIQDRGVLVTFVELASIAPALASNFGGPRNLAFQLVSAAGDVTVSQSTRTDFDQSSKFVGSARVAATKWRVIAGADKSEALRAAYAVSNKQFIGVAIALPLALLTLLFLHRGLARPIANLSAGVRKATEDLSAGPIDVAGPREVSQLVHDFNGLVESARHERELEERLRRSEKVNEHERELRLLADRERIGRDLHDTVIQRLFAVGMALESLTNRIGDEAVREKIARAVDDIDETIREVRAAIFDMEHHGRDSTTQVLNDVVADLRGGLGFEPTITFAGPVDDAVPAHVADQMAATLRESLTNAARHSSAGRIEVEVRVADDIALIVRDNGVGISDAFASSGGLGLKSMRARAERLGGHFTVDRDPGGGTLVEWRVPRSTASTS